MQTSITILSCYLNAVFIDRWLLTGHRSIEALFNQTRAMTFSGVLS